MSNGTEADLITTLNPVAASINAIADNSKAVLQGLISIGLMAINEKLFVTKTVKELTFEG